MKPANSKKPVISVVIPSYNQKSTILKAIQSIYTQDFQLPFEVIVVDSSDEDISPHIKDVFPNVKIIRLNKQTYAGTARNIGIAKAKGKIIAHIDTDGQAFTGWFREIMSSLKKCDMVGGSIEISNKNNMIAWAIYLCEFSSFLPNTSERKATCLLGGNLAYKKSVWKKIKWSSQRASTDLYFTSMAENAGIKLSFNPRMVVYLHNQTNLLAALKTQYWIGKTSALTRKKIFVRMNDIMKFPLLIPLLPFYRLIAIGIRSATNSFIKGLFFLMSSHFIFLMLVSYTIGFARGWLEK